MQVAQVMGCVVVRLTVEQGSINALTVRGCMQIAASCTRQVRLLPAPNCYRICGAYRASTQHHVRWPCALDPFHCIYKCWACPSYSSSSPYFPILSSQGVPASECSSVPALCVLTVADTIFNAASLTIFTNAASATLATSLAAQTPDHYALRYHLSHPHRCDRRRTVPRVRVPAA